MPPVIPNKKFFDDLCNGKNQEAVAKKLGIAIGTLRTLRGRSTQKDADKDEAVAAEGNGGSKPKRVGVSKGLIEYLAERLTEVLGRNVSVIELIELPDDNLIPTEPAFFEALQFGWFIDHARRRSGRTYWYREKIVELKHVPCEPEDGPVLKFTGKLISHNETFDITCQRSNDHHFSMTGVGSQSRWCFDASFTFRSGDVLCGTWTGVNHVVSNIAIYRMFLSKGGLGEDDESVLAELQRLSEDARIELVLEADEFDSKATRH